MIVSNFGPQVATKLQNDVYSHAKVESPIHLGNKVDFTTKPVNVEEALDFAKQHAATSGSAVGVFIPNKRSNVMVLMELREQVPQTCGAKPLDIDAANVALLGLRNAEALPGIGELAYIVDSTKMASLMGVDELIVPQAR